MIRARLVEQVDIAAARDEVAAKSEHDIEVETADKWAARAIASFETYRKTDELAWLLRAEDYRHEALEHAALVRDGGDSVARLSTLIDDAMGTSPLAEARVIVRATFAEGDSFEPFVPYEDPAQKTYAPTEAVLAEDEDFPGAWRRFRQAKDRKRYEALGEVSPPGWENTVKRMKKHPDITNPWALSWWMKGQGYSPRAASTEAEAFERMTAFLTEVSAGLRDILEGGTSQGAKKGWMSRKGGGGLPHGAGKELRRMAKRADKDLRGIGASAKDRRASANMFAGALTKHAMNKIFPSNRLMMGESGPASGLGQLLRKGVRKPPGARGKDANGHTTEPDIPIGSFRSDMRRKVALKKLMGPPEEPPQARRKPVQAEVV